MHQKRNNGLDLLRIISSFAVILIHANAIYLFDSETPATGTVLIIENAINLITRFSVPAFVMISGMFLLGNERNDNCNFYKRSFTKIGIPYIGILFFWVILSCIQLLTGEIEFSNFIKSAITLNFWNLWFMPMLIGLYLLTPFLNRLIKTITMFQLRIVSVFVIVWAMVSQPASTLHLPYSIGVVFAFLGYYLLGYALKDMYLKKQFVIRGGIFLFIMLAISMILRLRGFELYMFSPYVSFFSPTVIIMSIYLFLIFKNMGFMDVSWLSGKTYYIYLLHTPIYTYINRNFIYESGINDVLKVVMLSVSTFFISLLVSILYSNLCDAVMKSITRKFSNVKEY